MKVLVVGHGGREHALAWRLAQDPGVDEVHSAPGNPGMASIGPCAPIAVGDIDGLAEHAASRGIDLTVVGPEAPLVAGIADRFAERGLTVFGPSAAAAEIEGSKVFCRRLAERHGIPMAPGDTFDDPGAALAFAEGLEPPVVVKADGLAAGKGVLICRDHQDARRAVDEIMRTRAFGDAGSRVVVEGYLEGRETSIFAVTDGSRAVVLEPAQDYKRALDGDEGLNTGGMGAYSPVPWLDEATRQRAVDEVVTPVLEALRAEGRPYRGCLYAGLMITDEGPKLIEINARFGDPEIQAVLRRLSSDLSELLFAAATDGLDGVRIGWRDEAAVCVVVASGGYPGSYPKGVGIGGLEEAEALDDVVVFHAGTALKGDDVVTAGGRVLNVTALGRTISDARDRAYHAVSRIRMEGMHHRTDIAADA